jgi:hypothetical protein
MKIKQQITKHIIPFAITLKDENSFKECIDNIWLRKTEDNEYVWCLRPFKLKPSKFNTSIANLFCSNVDDNDNKSTIRKKLTLFSDRNIGIAFSLRSEAKINKLPISSWQGNFKFKSNYNCEINQIDKLEGLDLSIEEVELYLFRTGVGFLVISSQISTDDLDEYSIFYNYFRSLSINRYINIKIEDFRYDFSMLVKDFFLFSTENIKRIKFFENDEDDFDLAMLQYSGTLINEYENNVDINQVKQKLFMLRRAYSEIRYPISEGFIENTDSKEVVATFGNSIWGSCLEGSANIRWLSRQENSNSFIDKHYLGEDKISRQKSNFNNGYFYMYILALHERFALLNMLNQVSKIPNSLAEFREKSNRNQSNNDKVEVLKLMEKSSFFKLKYQFNNISNITHYNYIYDLFSSTMRKKEMMQELDNEIEGLSSLIMLTNQYEKEIREKRINKASWGLALFATTAQASSIFAVINELYQIPETSKASIFISTLITSAIVWFGAVIFINWGKSNK